MASSIPPRIDRRARFPNRAIAAETYLEKSRRPTIAPRLPQAANFGVSCQLFSDDPLFMESPHAGETFFPPSLT